jgi:hypothetical protein
MALVAAPPGTAQSDPDAKTNDDHVSSNSFRDCESTSEASDHRVAMSLPGQSETNKIEKNN